MFYYSYLKSTLVASFANYAISTGITNNKNFAFWKDRLMNLFLGKRLYSRKKFGKKWDFLTSFTVVS